MCYLLGINDPYQLPTHPLYGPIFETFIVTEFLKCQANHQTFNNLYYWRNKEGLEADLAIQKGSNIDLLEIKSSQTIPAGTLANLEKIRGLIKVSGHNTIVYAGKDTQKRTHGQIIPWQQALS